MGCGLSRREFLESLGRGGIYLGFGGYLSARAPREGKPLLSFGAVADAQFADAPPKGTRYYRQSPGKLAAAVRELNRRKPDFSIHLGDFIDRDFKSFDRMIPIWGKVKAPRYHVLGNHDFNVGDGEKGRVVKKLGLDRLGPGKGYYAFSLRGWRFLVLDGNALSLQRFPEGSTGWKRAKALLEEVRKRKAPNAMPWNGALGKEQWAWMVKELDRAAGKKEKVILFSHYPVYPPNIHNQWDDRAIVKLLDGRDHVFAWIDGHNHAGNYGFHGGVHYLNLPGMVETPRTTAYALVEVHEDFLKVEGFGRTPSRLLERAVKGKGKL